MLYLIAAGDTGYVKAGWAKDPFARLRELQVGNHEELRLIRMIPSARRSVEQDFHSHYYDLRSRGEWFRWHPSMLTIQPHELRDSPLLHEDRFREAQRFVEDMHLTPRDVAEITGFPHDLNAYSETEMVLAHYDLLSEWRQRLAVDPEPAVNIAGCRELPPPLGLEEPRPVIADGLPI